MRSRSLVLLAASASVAALACSHSSSGAPPAADGGALEDGAAPEGSVTIHTSTPLAPANATWAASLDATGSWVTLAPSGVGTYVVAPTADTWSVAFTCASDDRSLVAIYQRPRSVTTLAVELESQCDPEKSLSDLTGTFNHVPSTTTWLDFGYALDNRGFVLPADGDKAAYELFDIFEGEWDLGFGFRDQGGGPLTKIVLLRGQKIAGPTKLDIDVGAKGVDPQPKKLVVNGIGTTENLSIEMRYALGGGVHGVDVGPQDVPHGLRTADLKYVTVPPAAQAPNDAHHFMINAADADKETATTGRLAVGTFHTAIDVSVELPAAIEAPRAELVAAEPYVRLKAFVKTRANADAYELRAIGRVSNRAVKTWRVSVDASLAPGPEVELTMPDLSQAQGFDKGWAIPAGLMREVTGIAREKSTPLGDGTVQRSASHLIYMAP